jgi:hypothetical protein
MIVGCASSAADHQAWMRTGGQLQVNIAWRLPGIDGRDAAEPLGEDVVVRLERHYSDRAVNEHDVDDVVDIA